MIGPMMVPGAADQHRDDDGENEADVEHRARCDRLQIVRVEGTADTGDESAGHESKELKLRCIEAGAADGVLVHADGTEGEAEPRPAERPRGRLAMASINTSAR